LLPVALNADSRDWRSGFASVLLDEGVFESTGAAHIFQAAMEGFNAAEDRSYKGALSYYSVHKAALVLKSPKSWVPILLRNMEDAGVDKTSMEIDARRYLGYVPWNESEDREFHGKSPDIDPVLYETAEELDRRSFNTGAILYHESQYRPTIVMFSRRDPASVVLAGIIHAMYFWRHISIGNSQDTVRPILYFNDGEPGYLPSWLSAGMRTIVVDRAPQQPPQHGQGVFIRTAHVVTSLPTGISVAGKRYTVRGEEGRAA
jgi:hypothetical protein